MSGIESKKIKLIYLQKIFEELTDENHGISLNDIQIELEKYGVEVERKALYRDFEVLRTAGFNIVKKTGSDKKVTYAYVDRLFTAPEQKLLVDVIASSRIITEQQSKTLIEKLEKLRSNYDARELKREVIIADRPKSINEAAFENIGKISEAIQHHKKICFEYYTWNRKKQLEKRSNGDKKDISPCFLQVDNNNYYLIALDGEAGKIKHYRIDKMRNISILDEKAVVVEQFKTYKNKMDYCSKMTNMMSADDERIHLECKNEHIGIILDKFGSSIVIIPPVQKSPDRVECIVDVQFSDILAGWLIGVSDIIKLTGPASSIEKYRKLAQRALDSLS